MKDLLGKLITPQCRLLPFMRTTFITRYDRRLVRNVTAHRDAIRSIMKERKSGKSTTFFEG